MQSTAIQLKLFPPEAEKPGQLPGFSVRESGRAKRLSIKVFPRGGVEVVVPRRTKPREVQEFVSENREWIERARASFAADHDPESFALPQQIRLPAIGKSVRVRYLEQPHRKSIRYNCSQGVLTLSGRTGDEAQCVAAIRRWLAATAKREFAPMLAALSALTGSPYTKMHVRAQRSCWGSRSSSGTISLNLCLLFVEPALLRYLMIHELCHARHMNHSRRFWQRVGRFEADYKRLDRALGEAWRKVPAWLGLY
ncbi:MAG: SprT family zinc-dependent metalloprotease [Woeseiaceae bacterium]|nr:SprT family zinc-dependent metalloprotease [Woeseiaceae bacterium]